MSRQQEERDTLDLSWTSETSEFTPMTHFLPARPHLLQQDHRLVVLLRMSVFSFRLLQEYTVYYTCNVFIEVVKFFQKSFLFIDSCCQNNLSWLTESKRFSQNDAMAVFRAKPSFCSILIPGQCWLSDVSPYFVCRATFSLSLFILNCFSLPWNCDFCLSPVSLLERMTTYLSFLAIVHSCSLASVSTAFQEVSKNLWITTYSGTLGTLGWFSNFSLFPVLYPHWFSSIFPFYFHFIYFLFIVWMHAHTYHGTIKYQRSHFSPQTMYVTSGDWTQIVRRGGLYWQSHPALFWDLFSVIVLG